MNTFEEWKSIHLTPRLDDLYHDKSQQSERVAIENWAETAWIAARLLTPLNQVSIAALAATQAAPVSREAVLREALEAVYRVRMLWQSRGADSRVAIEAENAIKALIGDPQ